LLLAGFAALTGCGSDASVGTFPPPATATIAAAAAHIGTPVPTWTPIPLDR
jgi:hypothetical protein